MFSRPIFVRQDFYWSGFSLPGNHFSFCMVVLSFLMLAASKSSAEFLPESARYGTTTSSTDVGMLQQEQYPEVRLRLGDTASEPVTANGSGGIIVTIDTSQFDRLVKGNIPLEFHSKGLAGSNNLLWHPSINQTRGWYDFVSEGWTGQARQPVSNDREIRLLFKIPPEKAGRQFRILMERKDTLSTAATWSAVATQVAAMHWLGRGWKAKAGALLPVVMSPEYRMDSLLRWSHLVLSINMTEGIRNMIGSKAWIDQQSALTQCLLDFGQSWTVSRLSQYGRQQDDYIQQGRAGHKDAVKHFLATNPTNALMDCFSLAMTEALRVILQTQSVDVFMHSNLGYEYQTVDEDILRGLGKLITAYGLDLMFSQIEDFSSSRMAQLLLLAQDPIVKADISNAMITSVQYTLFEGYQHLFTAVARQKGMSHQQAALYGSRFASIVSFGDAGARLVYSLYKSYWLLGKANEMAVVKDMSARLKVLKEKRMFKSVNERIEAIFAYSSNAELDMSYWLKRQYVREHIISPMLYLVGANPKSEDNVIAGVGHALDTGIEVVTGGYIIISAKYMSANVFLAPVAPLVATAGSGVILGAVLFDASELNKIITGGIVQYGADALVDYFQMERGTPMSFIAAGQTDFHIMIEEVVPEPGERRLPSADRDEL
ncbi:MAG: hypothetical protein ACR2PT_11085 [Endozoicomonas sp.]